MLNRGLSLLNVRDFSFPASTFSKIKYVGTHNAYFQFGREVALLSSKIVMTLNQLFFCICGSELDPAGNHHSKCPHQSYFRLFLGT
jgi:hypothetical protein